MEAFFVVVMALSVLGVGMVALMGLRTLEAVPVPDPREARPRVAAPRRSMFSGRRQHTVEAVDDTEPTVEIEVPASWRKRP